MPDASSRQSTEEEPQTAMLLTQAEWSLLERVCRRFKLDVQPYQYDDYTALVALCDRIIEANQ